MAAAEVAKASSIVKAAVVSAVSSAVTSKVASAGTDGVAVTAEVGKGTSVGSSCANDLDEIAMRLRHNTNTKANKRKFKLIVRISFSLSENISDTYE